MEKILLHEIYGNIISTLIALIAIMIVFLLTDFVFARKIEGIRRKRQFRVRAFYIASAVFIFFMARIWVEGFTHLLAVLGLVSAALVISNKETIMNFVSWFVINWRGLFSEDDLIQIQNYRGYVKSFGVLYFTLAEISEGQGITGRVIRIPNGLIASNVLINFSQSSGLLEQEFSFIIAQECDPIYASEIIKRVVDSVVTDFYKQNQEQKAQSLKKQNKHTSTEVHAKSRVIFQPSQKQPCGIVLHVYYYSLIKDAEVIQQSIWTKIIDLIKEDPRITLSYAT